VLSRRAAEVAEIDRQMREIAHAVDPHSDLRELTNGIAGACRECGGLLSTEDRFCSACGTPASPRGTRPDAVRAETAPEPPPPREPGNPQEQAAPPAPAPVPTQPGV
jgi:hypothetical protein